MGQTGYKIISTSLLLIYTASKNCELYWMHIENKVYNPAQVFIHIYVHQQVNLMLYRMSPQKGRNPVGNFYNIVILMYI